MFQRTVLNDVVRIDHIITFHYFDYAFDFQFQGEKHDFWELVYVDNGAVVVTAGDKTMLLEKGQIILHRPMEFHSIQANHVYASVVVITFDTKSPDLEQLSRGVINASPAAVEYIAKMLNEAKNCFAEPLDIVNQVSLIKRPDAPFGAEQVIKNDMELLIISLIRQQMHRPYQSMENRNRNGDDIASMILKILEDHINENITLEDLGARLNFSTSFLKKTFKKSTGCGIHQMYIHLKISFAKKLLYEGNHSVSEISQMVGFHSIHHFSKIFKQSVGISPLHYAKSVRSRALL